MNVRKYFPEADQLEITDSVRSAELNTSGEIRVHIEKICKGEVLDRAAYIFEKLKMHETGLRNGVLFYLAVEDHKFAILGDAGINKRVPENFWDGIKDVMTQYLKEGNLKRALTKGIELAGDTLKEYFPRQREDVNELPDEISFGE